jgi:hypothetical protein
MTYDDELDELLELDELDPRAAAHRMRERVERRQARDEVSTPLHDAVNQLLAIAVEYFAKLTRRTRNDG